MSNLTMNKEKLINFDITTGPYSGFVNEIITKAQTGQSSYVCVANVHMFIEAHEDARFSNIIHNAEIITPDGKPLSWALRMLNGIRQERVAGMDLFPALLKAAEASHISVYFYGGSEKTLDNLDAKIKTDFPSLKVAGAYSPPFRQLTPEENESVIASINQSGAQLVFVSLGCPKQEKWMYEMKGKVKAIMIGIGGAIPVYAGLQKRAPAWMQQNGLEWFFRFLQEPRRLFRRYAVTNSKFLWLVFKEYINLAIHPGKKVTAQNKPAGEY